MTKDRDRRQGRAERYRVTDDTGRTRRTGTLGALRAETKSHTVALVRTTGQKRADQTADDAGIGTN